MRKFVRGGSDEARLVPYEGEEMARGRVLSESERESAYTMHCLGEKVGDIASAYGVSKPTIYRIIKQCRDGKGGDMAGGQQIVAGDKAHGRLMTLSDRNRFEGTCIVGGKSKKRTFTAVNAKNAQQQWEKWCQTLRDEQEFLDMVERRQDKADDAETVEEPKAACGHPSDPIEEIRPIVEVHALGEDEVHEAQQEFDAVTTKHMEATGVPLADTSEPAYLIWAKAPEPRCYGLYLTMDAALSEIDKLNEVAAFLGGGGAFEVEEVAWRG